MSKHPLSIVILGTALLLTASTAAQKSAVPQAVTDRFKALYPNETVKEWELERGGTLWEAEFMRDGRAHEACFKPDGTWLWTERDARRDEVPQAVWDALARTEYAGWKVDDIEVHSTPEHKAVYQLELEQKGSKDALLHFLPDGALIPGGWDR
jgi:uncharacterized membrane protein YkoI